MSLKNKLVRKTIKHYALSELKRHSHWLAFTAMGTVAGISATLLARSAIRRSRAYDLSVERAGRARE